MTNPVVINLSFPPSTNNLFINVRNRRIRSPKYDRWIEEAGWLLACQRPQKCIGPVALFFEFEQPDRRKRDITNLLKAPEDLLVKHGIIEADDCSIVRSVHASWSEAVGGCRITIEQLT